MKAKHFIVLIVSITTWVFLVTMSFAQSAGDCTVTSKTGNNLMIISCPDGSRTVDAGGRADLYRVGDRVDIYGSPSNQPVPRPGETPMPGLGQ